MKEFYNPQDVIEAARLMVSVADKYQGNNNFEFDLVDVLRQALAEKGRLMQKVVTAAFRAGDKQVFELASQHFLHLILLQDQLLGTRKNSRLELGLKRHVQQDRARKKKHYTNGMHVFRLLHGEIV